MSLNSTLPLSGHSICCPHPINLTDADLSPKGGLQLGLDTTGGYSRGSGTKLDQPRTYWLSQFVGMPVAIIQKNACGFIFITRSLTQAVSGGTRTRQSALVHCGLPRVTSEQRLQKVQSRCAFRVVFHARNPSLFKHQAIFWAALYQICCLISDAQKKRARGLIPCVPFHEFAGSWPIWKPDGTCISHMESETRAEKSNWQVW